MPDEPVEIFTVTHEKDDELDAFKFALSVMRPDVHGALSVLMDPHDVRYTDNIPGTTAVPRPEGRYPGNKLILVRPLRREGHLKRNRVAGTTIHEMGHGFRLSMEQRHAFVQLFDRTGEWREGPYWESVNEAFCYWLTRIATDGRLVSPYEARTLDLADDRHDDFLAILLGDPVGGRGEPEPNEPEPGPDPELAAMQVELDKLLEWQRAVREVVEKSPG